MAPLAQAFAGFTQSGDLTSILKLATTGLNVAGQYQSSKAEAEAVKTAGGEKLIQAQAEAEKLRREKRLTAGRQRALFAKAGVDISSGSPLEVMADTASEYEKDIATTLTSGQRAYALARKQAGNIKKAGWFSMGPTILSGLTEFSQGSFGKKIFSSARA